MGPISSQLRVTEKYRAWLYWGALAAIFIAGAWWRSNRYWIDPIGLWGDEAEWAERMFSRRLTDLLIRPIGFMATIKLLASWYSDERVLRLIPYLAGLGSMPLALYVGNKLFRAAATRLFFVFFVAFHPVLVDMSREFKPYSVEFTAHLGLVAIYLRWTETQKTAWLFGLIGASVVGFLVAYNLAFLIAVLFVLVAVRAARKRSFRTLAVMGAGTLVAIGVMVVVYMQTVSRLKLDRTEQFWGKKYDAFYLESVHFKGSDPKPQIEWLAEKYTDLAAFPGEQRQWWERPESMSESTLRTLQAVDRYGWILLHFAGVLALVVRKKYEILSLLLGPVLLVVVFNVLGIWPFDAFRVNTFLLAYFGTLAFAGADAILDREGPWRWAAIAATTALIVVPNLTIGFNDHSRKYALTFNAEFMTVFRYLRERKEADPDLQRTGKMTVLTDWYSCRAPQFYPYYHDGIKKEFGDYLSEKFEFVCTGTLKRTAARMRAMKGRKYWLIVTDNRVRASFAAHVRQKATILSSTTVRDTHDVYLLEGT